MSDYEEYEEEEVPLTKKTIIKPKAKKERTPAQMKAFEEAQKKRQHNIEIQKQKKRLEAYKALIDEENKKEMSIGFKNKKPVEEEEEYIQHTPPTPKKSIRKVIKKVKEESESEEEVIVVKSAPKKKKPKKKTIIIENSDTSSSESEEADFEPKKIKSKKTIVRRQREIEPEEENYKQMEYFPANNYFV